MITETPFLWFGHTIKGEPKPWEYFKIDGVMLNAYEILKNKAVNWEVRKQGIHNFLNFKGLVTIDSGGFLFMKKMSLNIRPEAVLQLYKESKPNYGVVLDYPIYSKNSEVEIRRRQLATLKNTKIMLELHNSSNTELIPVIHGHNIKSIEWYLNELHRIGDFEIYGIGSFVPAISNRKGSKLTIYDAMKIILYLRKNLLQNKKLHVFGVGSSLTMHLLFYAGVDSIDSSSWRIKATFGAIQLPGIGDRYITEKKKHKKYPNLSKDELRLLETCECPACKNYSLKDLQDSFSLRALHNAWVYQKEVETIRKLVKNNEYEEYVENMLKDSKFFKILKFIKKLKNQHFLI